MKENIKYVSQDEALAKLQKYCAYQERCHKEVRTKLLGYKIYGDALEEVISELISEDYLNEERYARSYSRGKFRMNKWGRNKIIMGMKQNYISPYCIKKGLLEIDEDEYKDCLKKIIEKKSKGLAAKDFGGWNKVYSYCVGRGYESYLISEIVKELKDNLA